MDSPGDKRRANAAGRTWRIDYSRDKVSKLCPAIVGEKPAHLHAIGMDKTTGILRDCRECAIFVA